MSCTFGLDLVTLIKSQEGSKKVITICIGSHDRRDKWGIEETIAFSTLEPL